MMAGCSLFRSIILSRLVTKSVSQRFLSTLRPGAELDISYLCDANRVAEIKENITKRDAHGDIHYVQELYKVFESSQSDKDWKNFTTEALKIPNRTLEHRDENKKIKVVGEPRPDNPNKAFMDVSKKHNWCRTENLGNFNGPKSYYFFGELVELEQAIIQLAVKKLLSHGFNLVTVPDILPAEAIENCGMPTRGERTQVFRLDERHGHDLCLSGTAEMGLGAKFTDSKIPQSKLPLKLAAISRCFRAETSNLAEEKGIFRVHQFTKLEMFAMTEASLEQSQAIQDEFVTLQTELYESLGLHFQVLDMASNELGNPALRKLDLEAWMPGRKMWGELCSCSDCGDFQSRRLNIRVAETGRFVHTVNGTAVAVPRTLMALVETHQNKDGTVTLPPPLKEILKRDVIGLSNIKMPVLKAIKTFTG